MVKLRRSVNILLTGVGAPGTKGTLYALEKNRERVKIKIVGIDMKDNVVGRFWSKKFYTVPAPESEDYVERINRICSKESIDVIVPQTTRETASLSGNRSRVDSIVTVSEASTIEKANNKHKIMEMCRSLDIPGPEFFLVRSVEELKRRAYELGYPSKPVVVKPPVSFGSRGFRILRENTSWNPKRFLSEKPSSAETTLEDLSRMFEQDYESSFPELLVTQYLPGSEYTVDAFRGEKISVAIPRLRKEIVNGISFKTKLEYRKDIIDYSLKLAESLDLKYAFGFQFKLDESGAPCILECNPRVQGTMVASVFSGVNVIWMAVREALGYPVRSIPKKLNDSEFYRYWGGLGTAGRRFSAI